MFALPIVIKSQDGGHKFFDGLLVSLPIELRDNYRIRKYAALDTPGWGQSEFGYSYYTFRLPLGQIVIFPGLFLKDFTKPSKRFFGYTATLSKLQVESLAAGPVSLLSSDIESVQGDLGMLVHDLRALSNSIYNPAKEAQVFIDRGDIDEARKRIDTVIAAQGILRMRTDALDFSGNAIDPDDKSEIAIFRKVDKVQRCFKTMAYNEGKSVTLSGNSYRKIVGQDFFELVPYTIIDNAVKYSPVGYDISVTVSDQGPETILVVKSYGPKIDENERLAIFTRYFRGREAIETKKPGTGIGLNIAAKIVSDVFSGQISFVQHPGYVEIDGLKYYETDFVVRVPSFL